MTDDRVTEAILAFATLLLAGTQEGCAQDYAHRRDWIDAEGRPMPDGHALFQALQDQRTTRSTLRLAV